MEKVLSVLLALCLIIGAVPMFASAGGNEAGLRDMGELEGGLTWTLMTDGALLAPLTRKAPGLSLFRILRRALPGASISWTSGPSLYAKGSRALAATHLMAARILSSFTFLLAWPAADPMLSAAVQDLRPYILPAQIRTKISVSSVQSCPSAALFPLTG